MLGNQTCAELAGSGRPLGAALRAEMEQAFGADLSSVRVHDDGDAQRSARSLNARAYARGEHVVLDSALRDVLREPEGRQRLAHELAHVLQQRAGGNRAPAVVPGTGSEAEAGAAAASVAGGGRAPALTGTAPGIARLVASVDVTQLNDEQLRAEHDVTQRWLLEHDSSDPEYQETLDYFQRLEQAVTERPMTGSTAPTNASASSAPSAPPASTSAETGQKQTPSAEGTTGEATPPEPAAKVSGTRCPCGGIIGPSGECSLCSSQAPPATEQERLDRIAELERRISDPSIDPAEVLRLNKERNALLAPDTTSAGAESATGAPEGPDQIPVQVTYEAEPAGPAALATGPPEEGGELPELGGGLSVTGRSLMHTVDPYPGNPMLGDPNAYTRFAGRGAWDLSPDLRPRLFQGGDPSRFAQYEAQGIRYADLSRLARKLRAGSVASLSAEEMALLRAVTRIHAAEGGVGASPLLSLTELLPEEALTKLPEVATSRPYIVRVRIDPADVVRVNDLLGKSGRTPAMVNELEVLVARDLGGRGSGTRILSIRANPARGAPLAGFGGGLLRWGGRALVVVGAALTIKDVLTASGPHRYETEGRAFGSFAGGTLVGAFATGLCIGLGVATGGAALLLCGLLAGAAGAAGGGWLGGRIGSWFD
jgi:hypothetical protein